MKPETANQRYVRLLQQLADATGPLFSQPDEPGQDMLAFEELAEGDYMTGTATRDEKGRVAVIGNMRITVRGRGLLEELKHKAEANTSLGMIRQNRFTAYKSIFQIAGGVIGGFLLKALIEYYWPSQP